MSAQEPAKEPEIPNPKEGKEKPGGNAPAPEEADDGRDEESETENIPQADSAEEKEENEEKRNDEREEGNTEKESEEKDGLNLEDIAKVLGRK